jgi:capsular polysaccharide biosynthesis protein
VRVDELVRSLTRRPVALLLVALVGALGAAYGWSSASTTYESRAVVLIIPPTGADTPGGPAANPLVNLDYSISQLALTVSSQLQGDEVRSDVVAAGGDGVYSADTLSSDNAAVAQLTPLISLTASGGTAEGAQAAAAALVRQASTQLAAIQTAASVPVASQAKVVTSAAPTTGIAAGNAQLRAAGVTGLAAGFVALVALVALIPLLGGRRGGAGGVPRATSVPVGATGGRSGVSRAEVRALLEDEWQRSGRNVPLTRAEARQAWRSAEARLEAAQRSGARQVEAPRPARHQGRG